MEKSVKEFNLKHLTFEQRREYDLNDPHHLRKAPPIRCGDDDPRMGPASMQKFNGEDLLLEERQAQQKQYMRTVLEGQMFEKRMIDTEHDGDDKAWQEEVGKITQLRNEIEEKEHAMRGQLRKAQQQENLQRADVRAQQRMEEIEHNSKQNAAELEFHSKDTFLNENAGHFLEGGRIRRDAYKGSTREERVEVAAALSAQASQKEAGKDALLREEKLFAREQERTRKQLIMLEQQKFRMRRAQAESISKDNKKVDEDHKANLKQIDESYKNYFSPEFFTQFGSSAR